MPVKLVTRQPSRNARRRSSSSSTTSQAGSSSSSSLKLWISYLLTGMIIFLVLDIPVHQLMKVINVAKSIKIAKLRGSIHHPTTGGVVGSHFMNHQEHAESMVQYPESIRGQNGVDGAIAASDATPGVLTATPYQTATTTTQAAKPTTTQVTTPTTTQVTTPTTTQVTTPTTTQVTTPNSPTNALPPLPCATTEEVPLIPLRLHPKTPTAQLLAYYDFTSDYRKRYWQDLVQTKLASCMQVLSSTGHLLNKIPCETKYGVEPREAFKAYSEAHYPNLTVKGDASEVPRGSVDFVYIGELDEMVCPSCQLKKAFRALKKGGAISVVAKGVAPRDTNTRFASKQLHAYSAASMTSLLEVSGFEVQRKLCYSEISQWPTGYTQLLKRVGLQEFIRLAKQEGNKKDKLMTTWCVAIKR